MTLNTDKFIAILRVISIGSLALTSGIIVLTARQLNFPSRHGHNISGASAQIQVTRDLKWGSSNASLIKEPSQFSDGRLTSRGALSPATQIAKKPNPSEMVKGYVLPLPFQVKVRLGRGLCVFVANTGKLRWHLYNIAQYRCWVT